MGQLETDRDLKPARGFDLGAALFGEKPARSMLTPYGVCTDDADRLFVCDSNAQVVHVFDLGTRRYAQWRPAGVDAAFAQPVGVAWDPGGAAGSVPGGRLLVADAVAGQIFVFESGGRCAGEIGAEHLVRPCGLAVDATTGRVFVADPGAQQVVVLSADGALVTRIGGRGTGPGRFNYPTNVALDSRGFLYVSDSLNFRVQVFDRDLHVVREIGSHGDRPGYFSQPKGIALDGEDHLYVVDARFEAVQIFDADGALLLTFGEEGTGPGQFWLPAGICVDANGRIWIADGYNRRVQVFDYEPEVQP